MIVSYQLEHKINDEWKATAHTIKIELPSEASHILNWNSLDDAFRCALLCLACEDELINYEDSRVTVTRSEG